MPYDARYARWFAGAIAAVLLASCAVTPPIAPADLIVIAPRMLDVRSGRYVRNRMIVIRSGKIDAIHPAARERDVVAKDRFVVPRNGILMPGLIDTHVHLAWNGGQNEDAARLTLLAGFTTVRNPGASGDADVVLRDAIEEGRVIGPRCSSRAPASAVRAVSARRRSATPALPQPRRRATACAS